jgi:hypothetical protein
MILPLFPTGKYIPYLLRITLFRRPPLLSLKAANHPLIIKLLFSVWTTKTPCRFHLPHGLSRGFAAARLLGIRIRIPPGAWMSVCCECYVLLGRDLCDGPITCPQDSTKSGMSDCDCKSSTIRRLWPCRAMGIQNKNSLHCTFKISCSLPL